MSNDICIIGEMLFDLVITTDVVRASGLNLYIVEVRLLIDSLWRRTIHASNRRFNCQLD